MAYGLRVYADEPDTELACVARSGTWSATTGCSGYLELVTYDSTLDSGFVYVGRVDFGETGTGVGTYTVTAPGITEIQTLYTPFDRTYSGGTVINNSTTDARYGRPTITVGTKSGDNFPVTVTTSGASDKLCMIGGSLEIFGR